MKIITAIKVFYNFILSYKGSKYALYLDAQETVDLALEKRLSLIRYGDGEFNYMMGKNVHYQKFDSALQAFLKKILEEYIKNCADNKYLVCMAEKFLSCKGNKIFAQKRYLLSWSFARRFFNKNYDHNVLYGDAFLFAIENQDIYKKLWAMATVDHIVLVHNDAIYMEQLKIISGKNCHFIKSPERNAFEKFNDIFESIINKVSKLGRENTMVVISAGPCAKALVYELAKKDIWAIDAGHCFCSPLHVMEN